MTSNQPISSTTLLYQPFMKQIVSAVEGAQSVGLNVHIFETFRSSKRQDELFDRVPAVTKAKGYESWHQYGLAVDIAFGGLKKWAWSGDFVEVSKRFKSLGLRWGGLEDAGHYEYDHKLSIKDAKQIALEEGIIAVWKAIESLK